MQAVCTSPLGLGAPQRVLEHRLSLRTARVTVLRRSPSHYRPRRHATPTRAQQQAGGGEGPQKPEQDPEKLQPRLLKLGAGLKEELMQLAQLITIYSALRGTVAVFAAYYLKIDPFGNLHWNSHDALLGLQCALPIMLLDALLMVPNYSPKSQEKQIKFKVPKNIAAQIAYTGDVVDAGAGSSISEKSADAPSTVSSTSSSTSSSETSSSPSTASLQGATSAATAVSEAPAAALAGSSSDDAAAGLEAQAASSSSGDELVEIERTITTKVEQPPLLSALYKLQMEKVLYSVSLRLSLPSELLLLLSVHLTEEMLYRAVILTLATGWTIDRLYEAGVDDIVTLGGMQLATPQLGALLAAVGCTVVCVGLMVQRSLFPIKIVAKSLNGLDGEGSIGGSSGARLPGAADSSVPAHVRTEKRRKAERRAQRMVAKLKEGIVEQQRWGVAVEAVRDVVEWAAYSTSFLLTGNLLAPFISASIADMVFTFYQRSHVRRLREAQGSVQQRIKELRDMALLAQARTGAAKGQQRERGGSHRPHAGSEGSDSSTSSSGPEGLAGSSLPDREDSHAPAGKPEEGISGSGSSESDVSDKVSSSQDHS